MAITDTKVGKVPVVYIAGALAAVVLLVVAMRMKPATEKNAAEDDPNANLIDSESNAILPAPPSGTVVVAPQVEPPKDATERFDSNERWLAYAVTELGKTGVNPLDAQKALSLYLDGASLTYDQGQWINRVIAKLGLPPFPPSGVSSVGSKPIPAPTNTPKKPLPKLAEDGTWGWQDTTTVARVMRLPQPITDSADFWRKVGAKGGVPASQRTGAANVPTVQALQRWAGGIPLTGRMDAKTIKRVQHVANAQIAIGNYA